MPDLKQVRCPHCNTLFGIEGPDGALHIKLKDLYRDIDGRVSGPCRKCGSLVAWSNADVLVIARGQKSG